MRNVEEKFKEWLTRSTDPEVNEQLARLASDEKAKTNAFYKDLEFGTGGLRENWAQARTVLTFTQYEKLPRVLRTV